MGQFPLLDIVIGLTLIYTFLSLLSSELTEFFTTVWRWRAKHLQQGIITLFGESSELRRHPEQFKNSITGKLYYSSLIASITQRSRRSKPPIGPSYIPPEVFADALLEVLQSLPEFESKEPQIQQDVRESVHTLTALLAKVERSPELPPRLKDNLKRLAKRTQEKTDDDEQRLEQFRNEIALWFEQSTARISGVYRRNVKTFTVVVSSALAVLINADSLYMLRRISENTATRTVIIQNAVQIEGCQNDLSSPNCMSRMGTLLDSTTLPIGWHPVNRQTQFPRLNAIYVIRAIIGWLLTGIAISMGSRFWFQILDKFIHIRETGERPLSVDERQRQLDEG
jgi:hypothetical protein